MIDWSDIDTVLLDMDGTLLDLHFDNFFWLTHLPARYAEIHGGDSSEATRQLTQRFERQRGSLNWYCLDYWSEQLDLDIALLKREVAHLIALRPYAGEFLEALRASDKACWLVTNAHSDSVSLKLERVVLEPWLDRMVISHDLGAAKESALFWERLQKAHPFDPARTLLIDDTEAVLAAAADFGIRYLLTLSQPDSSRAPRDDLRFPQIHHFDEIMPATARGATGGDPA